jgi:magnesium-transporting ATPase (P-type)
MFVGECISELPSASLESYKGKITICEETFALTINQMLMKGAVLKNTDYAIGFVVYTGLDTKLMMNSQKVRFKQSKLDLKLNKLV